MKKTTYVAKYEQTPSRLYNKLKIVAKTTRREMKLTLMDFLVLRGKPCHYCGGELPKTGTGVDRKDNSKGYTVENAVPCCWPCNQLKGKNLTAEELLLVLEFRKNGKISASS